MHHTPYFELRETLITPGCPICALAHKVVQRALESLAYEYANDYQMQARLRTARGFCNEHAWQLAALPGAALDVAILSRAVLMEMQEILKRHSRGESAPVSLWQRLRTGQSGDSAALASALEAQGPCPLCETRTEAETQYLGLLLEHLDEPEMQAALEQSGGLCWPHLRQALHLPQTPHVATLLSIQERCTARLIEELNELIRKYDYRFTHEEPGAERGSWLRANALISGSKGLW